MNDPSRVRFFGPLEPFAAGFAAELSRQGYTRDSACMQMRLMAHVSRWLADAGLDVHRLCAAEVERFLGDRRGAGYTFQLTEKALRPILTYLRQTWTGAQTWGAGIKTIDGVTAACSDAQNECMFSRRHPLNLPMPQEGTPSAPYCKARQFPLRIWTSYDVQSASRAALSMSPSFS